MSGYNTNLASEFYVLAVLHRLGLSATITLGNKKSVDIVIARDAGDVLTVDVKGLAGKTSWPVDNLKEGRENHFVVFISFVGKIDDPSVLPEAYVVPSQNVDPLIYRNPAGTRKVVELRRARTEWTQYRDAWNLLR